MIEWLIDKKIFRNANHAIWFFCGLGFFLLILAHRQGIDWKLPAAGVALLAHLPPLATAIVVTRKRKSSEIYSKDCIWFNAVMLIFYFFLLIA